MKYYRFSYEASHVDGSGSKNIHGRVNDDDIQDIMSWYVSRGYKVFNVKKVLL